METRDLEMAQHEAAHVVVGCAMGLRLREVIVRVHWDPAERQYVGGVTCFDGRHGTRIAWELMGAAGIAWSKIAGCPWQWYRYDMRDLKRTVRSKRGRDAVIRASMAVLRTLPREHARVTRALLERDLSGGDIAAMARGENLD